MMDEMAAEIDREAGAANPWSWRLPVPGPAAGQELLRTIGYGARAEMQPGEAPLTAGCRVHRDICHCTHAADALSVDQF